MSKRLDLTGKKFGRLTVLGLDEELTKIKGRTYWVCRCECGKVYSVMGKCLVDGTTKSCGCLSRDRTILRNTKHNLAHTRLSRIWSNMKNRCSNKNDSHYDVYGGRGIKVCEEWANDFVKFKDWAIANGYNDNLSIDRIDNNGNYCPENCRWVDTLIQANNKTTNVYITIDGETKSLMEWFRIFKPNYCYDTIRVRYHKEGFQSVDQLFRDKAS